MSDELRTATALPRVPLATPLAFGRASLEQRGAVLVEFALSSLIIFTVMLGTLQLGVIGLEQIKADGAAFTGAHQTSLGATGAGVDTTLVPNTYPGVTAAQISSTPMPLPSASALPNQSGATSSEPVDYDLSNTTSRHGGFSLVQPTQIVETVIRPMADNLILGATGSMLNLSGFAVEPEFQEVGIHGNVAGTGVNDIATFNNRNNYQGFGDNTPPYFVGLKYMEYCTNLTSDCNNSDPYNPFVQEEALGLAEYLDIDNWGAGSNGVAAGAVFADTLAHQQVYAAIANDLANLSGGAAPSEIAQNVMFGTSAASTIQGYLNPTSGDAKIVCMYGKWDVLVTGAYQLGASVEGTNDPYLLKPSTNCLQ